MKRKSSREDNSARYLDRSAERLHGHDDPWGRAASSGSLAVQDGRSLCDLSPYRRRHRHDRGGAEPQRGRAGASGDALSHAGGP